MSFTQTVEHVRATTDLASYEEADRVTRATLFALQGRLAGARDPIVGTLVRPPEGKPTQSPPAGEFDVEEFYRLIAADLGVSADLAAQHARTVVGALRSTWTLRQLGAVLEYLPRDYADLFGLRTGQQADSSDAGT